MATTATGVITEVLNRVRETNPTAPRSITRPEVLSLLTSVQLALVRGLGLLIRERNVATGAGQILFPVVTANVLRTVDVYHLNVRLSPARWTQLIHARRDWYTHEVTSALAYQCWAPLGTENFLAYPAFTGVSTLVVKEQQVPAAPVDDNSNIDLPDEHVPQLLRLLEMLLLIRIRDVPEAKLLIDSLQVEGS